MGTCDHVIVYIFIKRKSMYMCEIMRKATEQSGVLFIQLGIYVLLV